MQKADIRWEKTLWVAEAQKGDHDQPVASVDLAMLETADDNSTETFC